MDDLQYVNNGVYRLSDITVVLNLVINGWPSILKKYMKSKIMEVLNLVINGWPSIPIMIM